MSNIYTDVYDCTAKNAFVDYDRELPYISEHIIAYMGIGGMSEKEFQEHKNKYKLERLLIGSGRSTRPEPY